MFKKSVLLVLSTLAFTACSTIAGLTVKDYKAKNGQRVMGGQTAPKSEYNCKKTFAEKVPWGVSGNMSPADTQAKVTAAAVDKAPSKKANYVNIQPPSKVSVGAINVKAFSDAEVEYYNCQNLPAVASK